MKQCLHLAVLAWYTCGVLSSNKDSVHSAGWFDDCLHPGCRDSLLGHLRAQVAREAAATGLGGRQNSAAESLSGVLILQGRGTHLWQN